MTKYEMAADLLETLWRCDDILMEDDYWKAWDLAKQLTEVYPEASEVVRLMEEKITGPGELEQDALFQAQEKTEAIARTFAEEDGRLAEFISRFPWLLNNLKEL